MKNMYIYIGRNMLEFEISFNISKKKLNENKIYFCSKYITCMLKASNNHFGVRSKIKLLKIMHFFNLKSAKITKKCGKIFSELLLVDTIFTKHKKYTK